MRESKVVSMCPKCSKIDVYASSNSKKRYIDGEKYQLHNCPICGERYLAKTYGYHSILRFHGDNFVEQMESILEITPSHFESFISQLRECETEERLLAVVQSLHGDVKPMSKQAYLNMVDQSLIITEDLRIKMEEEYVEE